MASKPMMDRRVKERLIGATILVALIVLIVPELLSGPKPPPAPSAAAGLPSTRSVSVDLTTSTATAEPDGAAPAASTAASAAPAAAPGGETVGGAAAGGAAAAGATAGAGAAPDAPALAPAPTHAPTVTTLGAQEPPPLETPVSSPKSPVEKPVSREHGWAVQLGSFASKSNAEKLVRELRGRGGAPVYVSVTGTGPKARYRVRIGPLADRAAAEHAASKMRAAGHPATLVTPAS